MNEEKEEIDMDKPSSQDDHPIIGGVEPAIPPITIFWEVLRFSQIVYMKT